MMQIIVAELVGIITFLSILKCTIEWQDIKVYVLKLDDSLKHYLMNLTVTSWAIIDERQWKTHCKIPWHVLGQNGHCIYGA